MLLLVFTKEFCEFSARHECSILEEKNSMQPLRLPPPTAGARGHCSMCSHPKGILLQSTWWKHHSTWNLIHCTSRPHGTQVHYGFFHTFPSVSLSQRTPVLVHAVAFSVPLWRSSTCLFFFLTQALCVLALKKIHIHVRQNWLCMDEDKGHKKRKKS